MSVPQWRGLLKVGFFSYIDIGCEEPFGLLERAGAAPVLPGFHLPGKRCNQNLFAIIYPNSHRKDT
jgi:hypothetical protein